MISYFQHLTKPGAAQVTAAIVGEVMAKGAGKEEACPAHFG